jgi:hypothetical protein
MYFHGTPSSRLDLCFGEQLAAEYGVRLVSFDRPGYGGSTPASFGLASIAADAHAIADELGIARFATLALIIHPGSWLPLTARSAVQMAGILLRGYDGFPAGGPVPRGSTGPG